MAAYAYCAVNSLGVESLGEVHALPAARASSCRPRLLATDIRNCPRPARTRPHRVQEDQAEVASDLLAPVHDDDRGRAERRQRARDPGAAERRQVPRRRHPRAPAPTSRAACCSPSWRRPPRSSTASTSRWWRRARRPASSTRSSTASPTRSRRRRRSSGAWTTLICHDRCRLRHLVLVGMLLFLVPVFVSISAQLGGDLPAGRGGTRLLGLHRGDVVRPLPGRDRRLRRQEVPQDGAGRRRWDRQPAAMKIGDVVRVTMARFSRTLSTPSPPAWTSSRLEIAGQTAGNWVVEGRARRRASEGREGVPIAQPLIENSVFPAMVSQMVKISEEVEAQEGARKGRRLLRGRGRPRSSR